MVQSADEYPFWSRWVVDALPASDITSVNYNVRVYNPTTNAFDSVSSGTVSSADANGKWIAPFTIPTAAGFKKYVTLFTPVGGSHPVLNDEIDTLDGLVVSVPGGSGGTETHSGTVCSPDELPLSGVMVKATPYGTTYNWASAVTDVNGEYTLTGLVVNHAYQIYYNKDGYWAKQSEVVIA